MMLNGLGIEDKRICDCLVAFHKDKGGRLHFKKSKAFIQAQVAHGASA